MKFLSLLAAALTISGSLLAQTAPTIDSQPSPTTKSVVAGTSVTYTAAATGETSVAWTFSANNGVTYNALNASATAFSTITGAATDSLTIVPATALEAGYLFRATYTNATGSTNTSTVKLIVTATAVAVPTVTSNPASVTSVEGDPVNFFAAATGVPTPTVKWQRAASGSSTFTDITDTRFSGRTSTTLNFTTALSDTGSRYRAVFTNLTDEQTNVVNSNAAVLTVTAATTPTPTPTPGGTNSGGVLVYGLNFKHLAGFGIDFFEDGYVVLPATGGAGEVLFLGRDHGKRVYSRQTGVKSFVGQTRDEKFTVVAMAGTTGATLSAQAYGKADDKLKANNPTASITVRTARTLHGLAQASLDESTATTVPADGSLGFVEFAEMKLAIDDEETNYANDKAWSVTTTVDELVKKVKSRKGYAELKLTTTTTTTDGSNTSTTDTTTTTTTTK